MIAKPPRTDRPAQPSRLSPRTVRLAWAALFWERLWPAAWPATGILGLFLVVALSGVFDFTPLWLHSAMLALFGLALGWSLYRPVRRLGLPSIPAAERRIERDSGLDHRPLTAIGDRLAVGAGDEAAEALWQAHLARMRAALGRIRVALPHPGLAKRDPHALRLLLVLLLGLGLVHAGRDAPDRILQAFSPALGPLYARTPATVELWLTPPAYTGLAPIFLRAGGPAQNPPTQAKDLSPPEAPHAINVPAGSKLLARVQGGAGQPELAIGERIVPFKAIDASTYQLEDAVSGGNSLTVRQGRRPVAQWTINVVPDQVPLVAFANEPTATARASLRLEYKASDDYGLASVKAHIRRVGAPPGEAPIVLDLPLGSGHPRQAHEISFHDLTPHPWAGLPVVIELDAADEPGQVGRSEPFAMNLPERVFHHPVARAIVEQRKELTKNPATREDVADTLSALASHPEFFNGDIDVFLALIAARSQLHLSDLPASIASVQQLLWDTALAIEDGHLSVAERELRDLQRQLAEALEHNAPDKEIQDLIAKLRDAIQRYLQEMARQQLNNPDQRPTPLDPNAQVLQMRDLQKMLDRMREMAQSGARDAARQLLAQLQDMLENLRAARAMPGGQSGQNGASSLMRGMDDLINQQDRLLQRSFRESHGGAGAPMQRPGAGSGAAEQEALRRQLGEIMRRMGEMSGNIPGKLGSAERAMRDAVDALNRQAPGDAVPAQTQALDALRQGREAMMQGLRRQLGQEGDPRDLDAFGPARDPMGRVTPGFGNFDANDVQIPEHSTIQRTREIQDELQRRAGERQRPEIELDYIDRLLKRFQ